ncbi:MAG: hypothetical protein AB7H90_00955 [Alphaproteobacteria bacterium]
MPDDQRDDAERLDRITRRRKEIPPPKVTAGSDIDFLLRLLDARDAALREKDAEIVSFRAQLAPSGDDMSVAHDVIDGIRTILGDIGPGPIIQLITQGMKVVAAALAAVRADEQEECAKIVDGVCHDLYAGSEQLIAEGCPQAAESIINDAKNLEKIAKFIRDRTGAKR